MFQAGLKIPPGFALSVSFFNPWIQQLKQTEEWFKFLNSDESQIETNIQKLKEKCKILTLNEKQREELYKELQTLKDIKIFAVRSSSPEEDLAGASFAGGYETYLGVKEETLEESIRKAFQSCLDYRVFVYKKNKGFSTQDFSIAIIVMAQIASEIAGVGFSLNPLNNDYDEAVFNANFGLGETVVAGLANPDQYIINKYTKDIIEVKLGKKECSIWLNENGGTFQVNESKSEEQCLDKNFQKQLIEQIIIIENYYNHPMDIEWAIEKNQLYILQARPITTHLQLPDVMITQPGYDRKLYLDINLCVQGHDHPYSILGASVLNQVFRHAALRIFGNDQLLDVKNGVIQFVHGRGYFNLSNIWSKSGKEFMASKFKSMNSAVSKILMECSESYVSKQVPKALQIGKFGILLKIPLFKILFPTFFKKRILNNIQSGIRTFDENLIKLKDQYYKNIIPIRILSHKLFESIIELITQCLIPVLISGALNGLNKIQSLFEKEMENNQEIRDQINQLIKSMPNNITNQMGLDLYQMAQCLNKNLYKNYDQLQKDFYDKKLSNDFYQQWENFMEKYGFRGETEIDIYYKRYNEQPNLILTQINQILNYNDNFNPIQMFEDTEKNRPKVFQNLAKIAQKKGCLNEFSKAYDLCHTFLGYRETHKYYLVKGIGFLREVILKFGKKLEQNGLLNNYEEIFGLKLEQIWHLDESNHSHKKEEILQLIEQNNKFRNVFLNWKITPPVIDSRGRILTSKPAPTKEGELQGQSVSFGKIVGKVKVLKFINEKPFVPGEILVTKATDPGWTPLIISSGAILLEVGGMLQHGALVSREFGKPCIVGIENITNILKDGEVIEVDAINGIIRRNIEQQQQ